ncbi:MAG: cob(I)yrinic acid a,c-diamide adenosyltransferase [Proteobacteria bacterium]|nr:cob(I)yrinic acid a,c-diamide adenosyltransferase [Pseudomonadota bacterium]
MKIYTKTGDKGKTSLFSGERIEKDHRRVEAYGNIDELNSILGALAASLPESLLSLADEIQRIQRLLFQAASWLATAPDSRAVDSLAEIGEEHVEMLEESIDAMQDGLPELKGFIIPGGSQPAAWAHVARTVCRRAERRIIVLSDEQNVGKSEEQFRRVLAFVNRLSDYLFMTARYINRNLDRPDIMWKE